MNTYLILAVDPDFDGARWIETAAADEEAARAAFAERYPDAIIRRVVLA